MVRVKIAAVQHAPLRSLLKPRLRASNALFFPEAWLTGYPFMTWGMLPTNDFGEFSTLYKRMYDHAVNLTNGELRPVQEVAKEHGVVVVIGINEKASEMSTGTLYNTAVIIDATGDILNVHRKVIPTNTERTVWGFGDGRGIKVLETAVGHVGCLLCWESFMPLACAALYAQNVEFYCAPTADHRENWLATMQHIGREGSCFVVGVAPAIEAADMAHDLPPHQPDKPATGWIMPGNGMICGPLGDVIAGPMREEKGLLSAQIDLGQIIEARRSFDVVGHYSRPDIFQLSVNRKPMAPIVFKD